MEKNEKRLSLRYIDFSIKLPLSLMNVNIFFIQNLCCSKSKELVDCNYIIFISKYEWISRWTEKQCSFTINYKISCFKLYAINYNDCFIFCLHISINIAIVVTRSIFHLASYLFGICILSLIPLFTLKTFPKNRIIYSFLSSS